MPERSGIDLVIELRRRGFRGPAIALTAFARREDRHRALESGFDEFVAKPAEPETLIATIVRALGRSSSG